MALVAGGEAYNKLSDEQKAKLSAGKDNVKAVGAKALDVGVEVGKAAFAGAMEGNSEYQDKTSGIKAAAGAAAMNVIGESAAGKLQYTT